MRPLLSALAVAGWTYVVLEAYRETLLGYIRSWLERGVPPGAVVDWATSLQVSWNMFVVSVIFYSILIQLAVYGLWNLTYRIVQGLLGAAAAFFVAASVVGVLWLWFFPGLFMTNSPEAVPPPYLLSYLVVNGVLIAIKYGSDRRRG
ncbi:MAG: hypothetical protein ABWJ97_06190, partial [Thermoproteus sp.]